MPASDPALPNAAPLLDRAELEQAFSLFTEASRQLVESYHELEGKVSSLTQELALANGALRQQFEEKAALSYRLSTLLEALPGGVAELNAQGVIETMNPAAGLILGGDLRGLNWQQAVAQRLQATSVQNEWLLEAADGQLHRLGIVANQLESGERILLIADLSESWRLRQQLEQHKRLAAMGELAAGLAHQLRTPLATAMLYTAHLSKSELGEPERARFGDKALDRLRHLESLIQNMLRFVRGQQAPLERVALQQVIEDAMQTVLPMAQAQTRCWLTDMPDSVAMVDANRKELTGALINLLDNAIQATTEGGQIQVCLQRDQNHWQLMVTDSGSGMERAVCERIFEPFFTTRKEGTGLGLAIVRNLMSAFGGEISVISKPGSGTSFTIRLPAAQ